VNGLLVLDRLSGKIDVMNGWPYDDLKRQKKTDDGELLSMSRYRLMATDMKRSLTKVRGRIVGSFLSEKMV